MTAKLTQDEVITLLQGQWSINHVAKHSFFITGNRIINIVGFENADTATYTLSWIYDLDCWGITVTEFGWNNVPIMTLNEHTFHLFEAVVDGKYDNINLMHKRG